MNIYVATSWRNEFQPDGVVSSAGAGEGREGNVSDKFLVSFSGGRSSAYMTWKLLDEGWFDSDELLVVFANTGKEREETLSFVHRCSVEWNLPIIWVEAVVNEGRVACTHKVVDYASASRNGEPFEAVIRKYGIPNMNYLHCTRELKANAIRSYLQSIGWEDYKILQGIRLDEPRRIKNPKPNVIYPLVHIWPTLKWEILDWWKQQPFNLRLKDHEGNCDGCHKKSTPKLVRIAQERPQTFDWWGEMEQKYGLAGYNEDGTPRTFYRGHRSAKDIVAMSKLLVLPPLADEEEDAGCSESCEAFA